MALGYYHGFGVVNPFVSLLTSNTNYTSLRGFPFQVLGLGALVILFLMAATSRDFWLKNLSAGRVEAVAHACVRGVCPVGGSCVRLGSLQSDRSMVAPALMIAGVGAVAGLHVVAGARERGRDAGVRAIAGHEEEEWIDVGRAEEIPDDRANGVHAGAARGSRCSSMVVSAIKRGDECAHTRGARWERGS